MKRKARARITTMREAAQLNSRRVEVILGSMCAKTRITETCQHVREVRRVLELEDQNSDACYHQGSKVFSRVSTVFIITAKFQDPAKRSITGTLPGYIRMPFRCFGLLPPQHPRSTTKDSAPENQPLTGTRANLTDSALSALHKIFRCVYYDWETLQSKLLKTLHRKIATRINKIVTSHVMFSAFKLFMLLQGRKGFFTE